ncbi:cupredoxin domain-containing protein [Candidatus Nitronereus thalassa]|uniref:Cupredoxin domain-containing protein n=1 Tax=Candidatus Nitronereus thalassa TaxID=3020898 RepID=A0ABU3K335_9BACT|nr:cupredoxin domain-containing protein [Candidatus Nitronereus thalassa]MDT7040779.1 cupredoxin domain-containing protein [Candidatus Nitronereus thalassa]
MRWTSTIVALCGIILFRTTVLAEGPRSYHITMEQPAPYYSPVLANVPSGSPVQWDNKTATVHTITHDDCLNQKGCMFDSGAVAPGESFTLSHIKPGTYPYFCRLHPIMRGTIIVKGNKSELRSNPKGSPTS